MMKQEKIYYTVKDIENFWKTPFNNTCIHDLHRKLILHIRDSLYKNTKYWGKGQGDAKFGVINTRLMWHDSIMDLHCDPDWSHINFWDNNSMVFAANLNSYNKKHDIQIDFKNGDIEIEWKKYEKYVKDNYRKIFPNPDNFKNIVIKKDSLFSILLECPHITRGIGDNSVNIVINLLKEHPDVSDIKIYNNGSKKDHSGIDSSFKLNGIDKTIQIKTFKKTNFLFKDKKYIFNIDSWDYRHVDFMAFSNSNEVYIFHNGLNYNKDLQRYSFLESTLWLSNKI